MLVIDFVQQIYEAYIYFFFVLSQAIFVTSPIKRFSRYHKQKNEELAILAHGFPWFETLP